MDWSNERYVRLYTRDTADWLAISYEAQNLLMQLLRKADRTGVIEVGKHGKKGAAIVLGRADLWPKIEAAVEELLADGCLFFLDTKFILKNFLPAQESSTSDAQRKREERERRRALLLENVTKRDEASQNVTQSHDVPDIVTNCHNLSQPVTPNQPNQPNQPNHFLSETDVSSESAQKTETLEALLAAYRKYKAPTMPDWMKITPERKTAVERALQKRSIDGPDGFIELFKRAAKGAFINGTTGWKSNLDWLLKENNAVKVLEGNYDNKGPQVIKWDPSAKNSMDQFEGHEEYPQQGVM